MTTTPSTASQAPAVSIEHDDEFNRLLSANEAAATDAHICGGDFGTQRTLVTAYSELVEYIDTKLTQAREEVRLDGYNKGWADASLTLIKAEARATAAEAKLEAIRQGLENLDRYDADYQRGDGVWLVAKGAYIDRADAIALLQPQPQPSGTDGLPG